MLPSVYKHAVGWLWDNQRRRHAFPVPAWISLRLKRFQLLRVRPFEIRCRWLNRHLLLATGGWWCHAAHPSLANFLSLIEFRPLFSYFPFWGCCFSDIFPFSNNSIFWFSNHFSRGEGFPFLAAGNWNIWLAISQHSVGIFIHFRYVLIYLSVSFDVFNFLTYFYYCAFNLIINSYSNSFWSNSWWEFKIISITFLVFRFVFTRFD